MILTLRAPRALVSSWEVAGRARREPLRRHQRAIVPFAPAFRLERFRKAFLLDVDQLVEGPRRALVVLHHQRAERNRLLAVGMVDGAPRLAVHAGDLAVLGLVIRDDGLEVRFL